MDIVQQGIRLLEEYFGGKIDTGAIGSALKGLLGGDGGQIDLAGLVSRFTAEGGLQGIVGSWLGDGPNEGIDSARILSAFGGDKVTAFARQLGVSTDEAAGGLAAAIPQMIDKFSSGENLLDTTGDLAGFVLGSIKGIL